GMRKNRATGTFWRGLGLCNRPRERAMEQTGRGLLYSISLFYFFILFFVWSASDLGGRVVFSLRFIFRFFAGLTVFFQRWRMRVSGYLFFIFIFGAPIFGSVSHHWAA